MPSQPADLPGRGRFNQPSAGFTARLSLRLTLTCPVACSVRAHARPQPLDLTASCCSGFSNPKSLSSYDGGVRPFFRQFQLLGYHFPQMLNRLKLCGRVGIDIVDNFLIHPKSKVPLRPQVLLFIT
jgi:hypothetical protein